MKNSTSISTGTQSGHLAPALVLTQMTPAPCLLTIRERLRRVLCHNVTSTNCTLCSLKVYDDQLHAFVHCSFNNGTGYWLIGCVRQILAQLQPYQIIKLDFGSQLKVENALTVTWFTAKTLQEIWMARVAKKNPTLTTIRAALEAQIMLLRKSRHSSICNILENLIASD